MRSENTVEPVEIGGYFGLTLPEYEDPFPDAFKFQSGRAALRAALEAAGIKRLLMPAYICGCVPKSLSDINVAVETYSLDDSLYPQRIPKTIPDDSAFLYVNYFGLCHENVVRLKGNIPANKLIVDNSQALFAPAEGVLASIYSVRKFLGVPDGGLLIARDLNIAVPRQEDNGSIGRMRHLHLRMAYSARDGYAEYLESEKTLNDSKPLGMSRLTRRLLASVDLDVIKRRRQENFRALAAKLDRWNTMSWILDQNAVPLCYPLIVNHEVDGLRRTLAEKNIFIPTYWPDVKTEPTQNHVEHRLVHSCLAVPCDQRYTIAQMINLGDVIASCLVK